jgi:transcription antitermination factor NusG
MFRLVLLKQKHPSQERDEVYLKMAPRYALHVAFDMERQVSDRFDQECIESFYWHTLDESRDKKRVTQQKFFPAYLFARFDYADRLPVRSIPQVVRVLGSRPGCPVIISAEEIEAFRPLTTQAAVAARDHLYLLAGIPITVFRGPLQGLQEGNR